MIWYSNESNQKDRHGIRSRGREKEVSLEEVKN